MAQRNEDTEFWNTKFVRELKGPYKTFWKWLHSACNHAGIWEIDIDHARMRTGFYELDLEEARKVFAPKILQLSCGEKWFLLDYPQEQFKTIFLNPTNTYHWGAIVILQKLALMDNDFVILREEMQIKCKPLYSNSKDAKRKIKGIISNENERDLDIINEPKKEKVLKEKIETKSFLTPFVQAFRDFKEMRVKLKKPLTERAIGMIHTELEKLAPGNEGLKILILNQSTMNGWQDVYALKIKSVPTAQAQSKTENIINIATAAQYQEPA